MKAIRLLGTSLSLFCVALAVQGCSSREADDSVRISKSQEKDIFISSSNLGPEAPVIIMSSIPELVYENGDIVITGGRRMFVASPSAWRAYTGQALDVEDAQRILAAAEHQRRTSEEIGLAAKELAGYIEEARASGRQRRELTAAEIQRIQQQTADVVSGSRHTSKDVEKASDDVPSGKGAPPASSASSDSLDLQSAKTVEEAERSLADRSDRLAEIQKSVERASAEVRSEEQESAELSSNRSEVMTKKNQADASERSAWQALDQASAAERDALRDSNTDDETKTKLRKAADQCQRDADQAKALSSELRKQSTELTKSLSEASRRTAEARRRESSARSEFLNANQQVTENRSNLARLKEVETAIRRWTGMAKDTPAGSEANRQAVTRLKGLIAEHRQLAPLVAIDPAILTLVGE